MRASHKYLLVLALLALMLTPMVQADDEISSVPANVHARFGVNVAPQFQGMDDFPGLITDFAGIEDLGVGWYSNWQMHIEPERPSGIEYAQMLPTRQWPPDWDLVARVLEANPGSLWMIGNEPETRGQGQHTPSEYAERYHQAYHFIRSRDPEAQVAIGGIVMPTPLRLRWLELCRAHYQSTYGTAMPIDVWNIHVQILQEKRGDWGCGIPAGLDDQEGRLYGIVDNSNSEAFEQLVLEFCTWLVDQGERDKPLIISEYGVLMPSSYLPQGDQSVLSFMQETFDFLLSARDPVLGYAADDGRLVQRWMWFSLNFPFYDKTRGGFNGALYEWQNPEQLTVFGEFFRSYVSGIIFEGQIIPSSADTYVDPARPDDSFGHEGRLLVRADHQGYAVPSLVRFDLSAIPADANLIEASLRLRPVARSNEQPINIVVRPAGSQWTEDCTYGAWHDDSAASEGSTFTLDKVGGLATHDVTAIVRQWLDGSMVNHGLVLDSQNAGNVGNVCYDLASSEWAEGMERGPDLWIQYMPR